MAISKIGKKGKEWLKAKPKLVEKYKEEGITRCENCGSRFRLDFHHRPSRASQKAEHTFEKTRLLCWECHPFFEHNDDFDEKLFAKPRGYDLKLKVDIMAAGKKKSRKPVWQQEHKCKSCRVITRHYICHSCGKVSIK
ncbi:MAG: HNH endonuclease [Candidatus Peribacteraceae bacterium]|nr:HNH endonuclease [Candidatus Peribacteraceae bacterium]